MSGCVYIVNIDDYDEWHCFWFVLKFQPSTFKLLDSKVRSEDDRHRFQPRRPPSLLPPSLSGFPLRNSVSFQTFAPEREGRDLKQTGFVSFEANGFLGTCFKFDDDDDSGIKNWICCALGIEVGQPLIKV